MRNSGFLLIMQRRSARNSLRRFRFSILSARMQKRTRSSFLLSWMININEQGDYISNCPLNMNVCCRLIRIRQKRRTRFLNFRQN